MGVIATSDDLGGLSSLGVALPSLPGIPNLEDLLREMPKGSEIKTLLASTGLNLPAVLKQSGLPPEAAAIVGSAQQVLKGKGLEGKLSAGADIAQGILAQATGPTGQVGQIGTDILTSALGVKIHAAGKIGGAAGTAIGTAILGPIGGAAGQAVGTFVGEGIKAIGQAFGISKGAKQERLDRERQRERDDIKRASAFRGRDTRSRYAQFQAGNLVISFGTPGTRKWEERKHYAVSHGKLKELTSPEYEAKWRDAAGPRAEGLRGGNGKVLVLASNRESEAMLKRLLDYEKHKTQEAKAKIKSALTEALAVAKKKIATRKKELRAASRKAPAPFAMKFPTIGVPRHAPSAAQNLKKYNPSSYLPNTIPLFKLLG